MAEDNGGGKPKQEPGRRRVSNYEGSKGWQERIYIPTLTAGNLLSSPTKWKKNSIIADNSVLYCKGLIKSKPWFQI
jgi:hypothetical protein